MRWAFALLLAACSFEHGALSTIDGRGSSTGDARPIDARIDAPIDASSMCLAQSTATHLGHHYFETQNLSWDLAKGTCASLGGHLVKIETMDENLFVTTTFAATGYTWIGLSDPMNTDAYVWTDGTPLSATYSGFTAGAPASSTNNCVDANTTSWTIFSCSYSGHGGVCECE